jgi:hypothetical protein
MSTDSDYQVASSVRDNGGSPTHIWSADSVPVSSRIVQSEKPQLWWQWNAFCGLNILLADGIEPITVTVECETKDMNTGLAEGRVPVDASVVRLKHGPSPTRKTGPESVGICGIYHNGVYRHVAMAPWKLNVPVLAGVDAVEHRAAAKCRLTAGPDLPTVCW